ncbi:KpsF/GutQ family sugar-phosphate isomerase [Methanoplanus endosymbiosus]|uniref:KpsF/GutQ family sugar-phosphate isomerase n=1 Tax=Methanoplanus endosymbiosus TaxID=33865 RepID=A0A9E7PMZ0_9EURY|nr:KpsF/GutQ family sugar-phosphate isomerase [Methanoplanus endosymbiosus]UUX92267.1 KpsF/GutQ family sugar-phosphate isomerase [Methanoplanus endosymbiosus]
MNEDFVETFKSVLYEESNAIKNVAEYIDTSQIRATINILDCCKGKFVLIGIGKSGIIAKKISATLNSIGCVSIYLHPSEALHGDFGIATKDDVAIIISNSGETEEIIKFLPYLNHRNVPVIAIVGNKNSILSQKSNACLNYFFEKEADQYNLVPTTSTTVSLAIGDAIAVILMTLKKVTPHTFALNHPAGSLGKRLTLKVRDIMHGGNNNPLVTLEDDWISVIEGMNKKSTGAVNVVDDQGFLIGIITDGDIRRILKKTKPDQLTTLTSQDMMTSDPTIVYDDMLCYDVLKLQNNLSVSFSVFPVIDQNNFCVGMIRIIDIHKHLGVFQ